MENSNKKALNELITSAQTQRTLAEKVRACKAEAIVKIIIDGLEELFFKAASNSTSFYPCDFIVRIDFSKNSSNATVYGEISGYDMCGVCSDKHWPYSKLLSEFNEELFGAVIEMLIELGFQPDDSYATSSTPGDTFSCNLFI